MKIFSANQARPNIKRRAREAFSTGDRLGNEPFSPFAK